MECSIQLLLLMARGVRVTKASRWIPKRGMIVLDVVEGRISAVEVLYRDDVREKLLELLP